MLFMHLKLRSYSTTTQLRHRCIDLFLPQLNATYCTLPMYRSFSTATQRNVLQSSCCRDGHSGTAPHRNAAVVEYEQTNLDFELTRWSWSRACVGQQCKLQKACLCGFIIRNFTYLSTRLPRGDANPNNATFDSILFQAIKHGELLTLFN